MKQDQFSKWSATKVKARADYTCQHCGSTENIQAHDPTGQHIDWKVGVALCGKCHGKEHPSVPQNLFQITGHQPYWPNISARSLAKEFHCHNRTVIRMAKRFAIPTGLPLTQGDRERLKNSGIVKIETKCLECGKEVRLYRPWQKFCSTRCRWEHWDKEHPRTDLSGNLHHEERQATKKGAS